MTLRLAELIAALSLATDLGMGQPMTHALRTCLLALGLGRALGHSTRDLADTYYTTLLRFIGCGSDAHDLATFNGGEDVRFRQVIASLANGPAQPLTAALTELLTEVGVPDARYRVQAELGTRSGLAAKSMTAHCEVASMLAARLGLAPSVRHALAHAFERWDGHGFPSGHSEEAVPVAVRLAVAARDIEVLTRTQGLDAAREALRERRGAAHDPRVVDAFLRDGAMLFDELERTDPWDEVLRREPGGPVWLEGTRLDDALTAFADFADVKTPFTLGHSRGVAALAAGAARQMGLGDAQVSRLRRAGLLHDVGRGGIANAIWERPGPLSLDQWERVRLHPYFTERVLACCGTLKTLAPLAGAHHERLDGSGYHRGSRAAELDPATRVLAAADACQAMQQHRPHRPARRPDDIARELRADVTAGRLDANAVDAVLAAAGMPVPPRVPRSGPGGLSTREVEVLCLMARGRTNREMADLLGITPKTVGHHVQHIYDKLGISTRAAAAVFALEHGLLV